MGRKSKKAVNAATTSKPPVMKFHQAAKIADKNSRTVVKILQLMEVTRLPGYAEADSHKYITERIATLKRRLNRRLAKLTKYADCPSDDRQAEFKVMTKSSASFGRLVQQQKMQAAASRPANSFGFGFGASSSSSSYPTRDTRSSQAAVAAAAAAVAATTAASTLAAAVPEATVANVTDNNFAAPSASADLEAVGAAQGGDGVTEEEGHDEAKSAADVDEKDEGRNISGTENTADGKGNGNAAADNENDNDNSAGRVAVEDSSTAAVVVEAPIVE